MQGGHLRKLWFKERPPRLVTETWDGKTFVEGGKDRKLQLMNKMVDNLSLDEIEELMSMLKLAKRRIVTSGPKPLETVQEKKDGVKAHVCDKLNCCEDSNLYFPSDVNPEETTAKPEETTGRYDDVYDDEEAAELVEKVRKINNQLLTEPPQSVQEQAPAPPQPPAEKPASEQSTQ